MTTYRLDRAPALAVAGVLVLVAAVAGFLGFVLTSTFAAVVTVVLLAAAFLVVLRPPVVVRLDEHGIRARRSRSRWKDVEDVRVADGLLLLTLVGGDGDGADVGEGGGDDRRAVRVTLSTVGARAPELVREVHDRLNTAHGYRRFG